MVMKRNMMRKNLYQSILKSLGRYLAIVAIIALGASMFVGLLMTKSDMVDTGQTYMDEQNMFDLRLASSVGWDKEHVLAIAQMDGVVDVEGLCYQDLVVNINGSEDEVAFRFYAIPEQINQIVLLGGRMPESPDECLYDGFHTDDSILGTTITVTASNSQEALDSVAVHTYTVVGYASTPLYMDMTRGTTTVGGGSLTGYVFVLPETIDLDYYPEIHVTIPGDYDIYTEEYNQAMELAGEALEPQLQPLVDARLESVLADAEKEYQEGMTEYEDGYENYVRGRVNAYWELKKGEEELVDAENLLNANQVQLAQAQQEIADGYKQLQESESQMKSLQSVLDVALQVSYGPLESMKTRYLNSYANVAARIDQVDSQIDDVDGQIALIHSQVGEELARLESLNGQISQLEQTRANLDYNIGSAEYALGVARIFPNLNAQLIFQLEAYLDSLNTQRSEIQTQLEALILQRDELQAFLAEPLAQIEELNTQREELEYQRFMLTTELSLVESQLQQVENSIAALDAQYDPIRQQLADAQQQIDDGYALLKESEILVAQGQAALADGWEALEEGKQQLADGKAEAANELMDANASLMEADKELTEAGNTLDAMSAEVFVLNRNSNIGYNSLDSASDIVQGVSRVFPAFFLLVAALVCITTMTRMIDEERTQIGTLKALGYSNAAIMNKYLVYAGSSAVVGCGLGVLVGSMLFPKTLWEAYKIMLLVKDPLELHINWGLCAAVVGAYLAVMLLVAWYCCRRTLQEVPAELIRPKSPDAGKKILLEYLPFWKRLSFLNKVMIRNIFRYRQRLAMMLVGIGGCTALLLTGYGLRDSIVNVVDFQFRDVTTYDMTVYFKEGLDETQQAQFRSEVGRDATDLMYYHQSSVDLAFNGTTREIYMISGDAQLLNFIDFHRNGESVPLPGKDELLISVGAADILGLQVGDKVVVRNAQLESMELTVSGIYENHMDNYCIVSPETIRSHWGSLPEQQMAFIKLAEGEDAYAVSAELAGLQDVLNVAVSADTANMVRNLMNALDLVVWIIVFCSGLLAATVLYNLTNINITERIREIATIKVLGFNASETAAYVFKENLTLTVVGTGFGLILGNLLLMFVMSQIKIDMVWFRTVITLPSYLWASLLTLLAALLVDFVFYFKLEKINMAEALKSVE